MNEVRQLCTFYLDHLFIGIDVIRVQEVLRYQQMTAVPQAPPVVEGLINLRGRIVTAIDMRRRLDLPPRPPDRLPMNVVLRTEEGILSLSVDRIGDVVEVSEAAFEAPPETVRGSARQLLLGTYKLEDRLLLVLDVDKTIDWSVGVEAVVPVS